MQPQKRSAISKTLISIKNQDSQESSNPHFSDAMLDGDTSSVAISQGDSDSNNECESGPEEFTCMKACSHCMDTIYETYGCSFEEMNKDESDDTDEYSDDD
ncbi:hypothetical protein BDC45DRAFT_574087 [Circinella umbellata]|nr:hypothetical protein BDC45DRAFT_574087 [Circinella umbellata]